MPSCEYCNNTLSNNQSLKRHYLVCKKSQFQQHIRELQTQREQHDRELQLIKDQLQTAREQLQTQREQYEQEIQRQQDRIQRLENQIFEIAKQPRQVNNTTNATTNNQRTNIINQLAPYDLTPERVSQIVESGFTEAVFHGGPDKICEFTVKSLLTDSESHKPKMVCTDSSRRKFKIVNADTGDVEVDLGFQKTYNMICDPLVKANLNILTRRPDQIDTFRDVWKVNDEFIANRHQFVEKLTLQLP